MQSLHKIIISTFLFLFGVLAFAQNFKEVSIIVNGKPNAAIYLNDVFLAHGSWKGVLDEGKYIAKCKLKGHEEIIQEININTYSPSKIKVVLDTPKAINGVLPKGSEPKSSLRKNRMDAVRPIGFTYGVSIHTEFFSEEFNQNETGFYGVGMGFNVGNYFNRGMCEIGVKTFYAPLAYNSTEGEPYLTGWDRWQFRFYLSPKYNIIRKKTKDSFYMYLGGELGVNLNIHHFEYINQKSYSAGLRLGLGVGSYELSGFVSYDLKPMCSISRQEQNLVRGGISLSVYW